MFFSKKKVTPITPVEIPMHGVVLDDKQFHDRVAIFLTKLSTILHCSYGPLGSNTLIEREQGVPTATKDGYTILQNVKFSNAQDNAIHELIKRVSQNLVKTVGDGSTSAVLTASFMYEALYTIRNSKYTRKQLLDVLDRIVYYIEVEFEAKCTHKVTSENKKQILSAIANVANNNDACLGDYISNLFMNLPELLDIRIELDPKDSTSPISHEIRYGFMFEKGPCHNLYMNVGGQNKSTVTILNPIVYMSYEFFPEHYDNVMKVQAANPDRNIVVITELPYSETLMQCQSDFLHNKNRIFVVKTNSLASEDAHNEMIDLAVYTDTEIIRDPKAFAMANVGGAKSVELHASKTIFLGGDGLAKNTDIYHTHTEEVRNQYRVAPVNSALLRGGLKRRLTKLEGVSLKILAGGITEEEKRARKFLIEDATLACRSTLEKGYSFGGNVSLYHASLELRSKFDRIAKEDYMLSRFDKDYLDSILNRVINAVYNTYYSILVNSPHVTNHEHEIREAVSDIRHKQIYNVLNNSYETIDKTSVLSSADTDTQILKASVSIIGTLLSINQFIA